MSQNTVMDSCSLIDDFSSITPSHYRPAITPEEYTVYLIDHTVFSLSFHRQQGCIYSHQHYGIRQQLFNHLSNAQRCQLFKEKIQVAGLQAAIDRFNGFSEPGDVHRVLDIGASHSVYAATYTVSEVEKTIVVKEESHPYQTYFTQLLSQLSMPSYKTDQYHDQHKGWRLSEKISDTTLGQVVLTNTLTTSVMASLAQQAALGDAFGRGDRHYNNYMVNDNVLYPIDIGHMFYANNDDWLSRYIHGGIAEINGLDVMVSTDQTNVFALFFTYYFETLQMISDQLPQLDHFTRHVSTPIYEAFKRVVPIQLEALLKDPNERIAWYVQHFFVFKFRQKVKQWFHVLIQDDPTLLDQPLMSMYAIADKAYPSTFFSLEDNQVVDRVCQLARDRLGVNPDTVRSDFETVAKQVTVTSLV